MSLFSFLHPGSVYPLPRNFGFDEYIETERELWALFPESEGHRVNFCQFGLTAQLYVDVPEDGSELASNETYILMPCPDRTMRPLRMRAIRRLTRTEYRMTHLTAMKLAGRMSQASHILEQIDLQILGPEIIAEAGRLDNTV